MATLQMYMDRSRINNQYEDPSWKEVWGDGFGVDNSVGKIRKILVHCPGEEILQLSEGQYEEEAGARILKDSRGRIRNYLKGHDLPNLQKLQEQHNRMTDLLRQEDIEVLSFDDPTHYWTNLVFTRDIALMTPRGAVICRPAMYFHAGEPKMTQAWMTSHGIPIVGVIQGTGTMEGGSFSMLDRHTAIIGRSVRINDEGIGQLRQLLGYQGIELIVLDHKSKSMKEFKKTENEMYKQQLLYSKYIHDEYGRWPDRLMFNLFKEPNNCRMSRSFTKEDFADAYTWATDVIERIEKYELMDFFETKKSDFFCTEICSCRKICPNGHATR